jgi:hypothetical protein
MPRILKENAPGLWDWGFQLKDETSSYKFSEGGLSASQEDGSFLSRYLIAPPPRKEYDKELCRRLITEYLTKLRQHTDETLENIYTAKLASRKEYTIVISSSWSQDDTPQLIQECAKEAGMASVDQLEVMSELDAVGVSVLRSMPRGMLNVHDTFILCDASGW